MRYLLVFQFLICSFYSLAAVEKFIEQTYATAMVLTNGESVNMGVGHFNSPAALFNSEQEVDNELRQDLNVFTLPISKKTRSPIYFENFDSELHIQASFLNQTNSLNLFEQEIDDIVAEDIYGIGANWVFERPVSSKWWFGFGTRIQAFHYDNSYTYNSEQSRELLQPQLDGVVANISSNALIANPHVEMMYRLPRHWGYYEYKTSFNYYYGSSLAEPSGLGKIRPEGWRYQNGIKARFNGAHFGDLSQAFYFKAHRVDIGGDNASAFGTGHFYEYGIGILFDTSPWLSWLENVGIGLNYHHGSALEGGSVVFYFNE
ncbi:Solitary outer membrane autotransporter beta-barrel domain [Pseudoalteromonas sp. GB56]